MSNFIYMTAHFIVVKQGAQMYSSSVLSRIVYIQSQQLGSLSKTYYVLQQYYKYFETIQFEIFSLVLKYLYNKIRQSNI